MKIIHTNQELASDEAGNNENPGLTIEGLKAIEGFEQYTDEEALEAIRFIDRLCDIGIRYVMEQNRSTNNENLAA